MKTTGLLCTLFFVASSLAFADDKFRSPRDQGFRVEPQPVAVVETKPREPAGKVEVLITPQEREIIQRHSGFIDAREIRQHSPRGLPPALAKKRARGHELPPGWQRRVVVGQPMPEEVVKVCQPLPPEIVVQLPPPPAGTVLVRVEGKIVRLIEATREILDVFDVRL